MEEIKRLHWVILTSCVQELTEILQVILQMMILHLDFILDERGRELFWECCRRTDLVRFNEFTTGTYLWAWKGGVQSGTAVDSKYNLYPIPSTDLSSNPNLIQNKGY